MKKDTNKFKDIFSFKKPRNNPFLRPFIIFALICCILICIVFICIIRYNESEVRNYYSLRKATAVLNDFEMHIHDYKEMSYFLSYDKAYHYSTLNSKYHEITLLDNFSSYKFSSILTDDVFLYYKEKPYLFHNIGYSIDLDTYFKSLSEEEKNLIIETLMTANEDFQILPLEDGIYILLPFNAEYQTSPKKATLGVHIEYQSLADRFDFVGGGFSGIFSLYQRDKLIYSNDETALIPNTSNVLTLSSQDNEYTLCYAADKESTSFEYVFIQILLFLLIFISICIIAYLFANMTYLPLSNIQKKYNNLKELPNDIKHDNIFEEMEYILDTALQNEVFTTMQIEQIQDILKYQLLIIY